MNASTQALETLKREMEKEEGLHRTKTIDLERKENSLKEEKKKADKKKAEFDEAHAAAARLESEVLTLKSEVQHLVQQRDRTKAALKLMQQELERMVNQKK